MKGHRNASPHLPSISFSDAYTEISRCVVARMTCVFASSRGMPGRRNKMLMAKARHQRILARQVPEVRLRNPQTSFLVLFSQYRRRRTAIVKTVVSKMFKNSIAQCWTGRILTSQTNQRAFRGVIHQRQQAVLMDPTRSTSHPNWIQNLLSPSCVNFTTDAVVSIRVASGRLDSSINTPNSTLLSARNFYGYVE